MKSLNSKNYSTTWASLVTGMRWLLSTYTFRFNYRHKLFGHVFCGRYKTLVVDGSGDGYLRSVCDYTHLNPVRAGMPRAEDRLKREKTLTMGWIVGRLQIGTRKSAVAKLHRWKKQRGEVDSRLAKTMV